MVLVVPSMKREVVASHHSRSTVYLVKHVHELGILATLVLQLAHCTLRRTLVEVRHSAMWWQSVVSASVNWLWS